MGEDVLQQVTRLVLQLAVVLAAAKAGGEVAERYLRVPGVLGEVVAGVLIGPFALGGFAFLGLGPLFPRPLPGGEPIRAIPFGLYLLGQAGAVVLLFYVGLETDLRLFVRYLGPAFLVAAGGVLLPFLFGAGASQAFGYGALGDPVPLFMGAIMAATSVGITARVLAEIGKLQTPEGVTVLAAAVVDDVLGILVLTIVVGIAATGQVTPSHIGVVALKAVGFWAGLTGLGLLLSRFISRAVGWFRTPGAAVALALALAFLAAGVAEMAGLAMIIGAYSIGLALSGSDLAKRVEKPLEGLYHALVPIFFVVMGMLVDISAVRNALLFGLVILFLAVVGKVVGCGLPALGTGFTPRGAVRVGVGMLPRGEVALTIAGVGLARGLIGPEVFGVSILMTLGTTLLAAPLLVPLFQRGGPGVRRG